MGMQCVVIKGEYDRVMMTGKSPVLQLVVECDGNWKSHQTFSFTAALHPHNLTSFLGLFTFHKLYAYYIDRQKHTIKIACWAASKYCADRRI